MKKLVCLYGTPNEIVNQLNAKAVDYAAARGLEYQWIPMQPFSNDAAVEALKGADAGIIDVEVYDKKLTDEELEGLIYWDLQPRLEEIQVTTEGYKIKKLTLKIDTE